MQAFRIIIETAKSYYEEMLFFFMAGVILLVFAIPAALVLPSIYSLLLLLPIPFGFAGIWIIAHRAVRGLSVKWPRYWEAVKEYGLKSLLLTLIILAGYAILLGNIWFYNSPDISPFPPKVAGIITPLWLVLALVWTGVAFYAEAFLIELEEPKILMILRNGLSLTVLRPLVTLILLIVTALLTALSIVLPILLIVSLAAAILLSTGVVGQGVFRALLYLPSLMPAVGTPEPGGLAWDEMLAIIRHLARKKTIVGADVVELSPLPDFLSADFTAAKLVYKIISGSFWEKKQ